MNAAIDAAVRSLGGDFLAEAFGRSYRYWSQAADLSGLLTWDDLNRIIARHQPEAPRLRLFADGTQVPPHLYSRTHITKRHVVRQLVEPANLHRHINDGASLVLDAVEELHPGVEDLATALERRLRTDVQINLYASWTPTEGFGVHWDDHDVVVFQLEGAKRWKIYEPTRSDPLRMDVEAPEPPAGEPDAEIVLHAGDILYLPRGWWHAVAATEGRSLHLTCGLTPATGHHLLTWIAGQLLTAPTVRASLPVHATDVQKAEYVNEIREEITRVLRPDVIDAYTAAMDAQDPGRPAPSLPHVNGVPADKALHIHLTTARATLHPAAPDTVRLQAAGTEWEFRSQVAPALLPLVQGEAVTLGELADRSGLTVDQIAALATELVTSDAATVTRER
ncbi:cupin domain-containing protein [Streptomyces boluensis]|uniref:Cupin n=1 Tax=Streptomyces boluensis TaxID=1775135 RepID=A0A964UR21_9ACTN|nr:cupin domain-containing protein [Streptomyces boluensis]NBE53868.1 cupin [Streptomyces boluensis]